ncbi:MAG: 2-hydroxyacid dehydrogenase [Candidatus Anstonellales archaeon]
MSTYKVLYLNYAPFEVYEIIRSQVPEGFELITLEQDDDQERISKIQDVDFVLVATAKLTKEMLERAKRLKLIQHQGVGYDTTDIQTARRLNIPVAITPEGTSIGVAEHTILLILAVYKRLIIAHNNLVCGNWLQFELRPSSYEMYGKTLGLIGFGRIGREVAKRARSFDVHILYYDKYVKLSDNEKNNLGVEEATFEQLLTKSDIVSLHIPLTEETRGLINDKTLKKMKPSAILINTARGGLVDEKALYTALKNKLIAGAGLDVFEKEPPSSDNPLLHLDNVVLTPHIAAGTKDALITKMRAAFSNMVRLTKGEPPINLVL